MRVIFHNPHFPKPKFSATRMSDYAAVSCLLESLSQILKHKRHLIAADIVESLCRELTVLKGVVKDSDGGREVVDEAEDAVDSYLVQAAVQRSKPWIKRKFQVLDYPKKLREIGMEIQKVSARIKAVVPQCEAIVHPKQAPSVEGENMEDFDLAVEEISKLLTQGPRQFAAVSIVGMQGLGKTTLAKNVLRRRNVDYHFIYKAFVCVSKEYERREVFLEILSSFGVGICEISNKSERELEEAVYSELEGGKSYLIVLDDVLEIEDWDKLKRAFPINNSRRCRVLITTRNAMVAEHANPNREFHYTLKPLPLEKSRELLRRKVFEGNNCPEELQKYEAQILEKCGGSPLAIAVIAGTIGDRVECLKRVADSVKDYNIGRIQEEVIELMYKRLPSHLKPCFVYLGVFPDGTEIPVWKLIRLWIAEGLIPHQGEGELMMEDLAEQWLEELVHRNLVMIVKRRSNDKIKTCRIHGVLGDFCNSRGKEENMYQVIKSDNLHEFLTEAASLDGYRRLCIDNANVESYLERPYGKRVRSFLAFAKEETMAELNPVSSIQKAFKLLKVLEIPSITMPRFPSDLCNLVLLKYVAISITFSGLPQAMTSMWNLQTLIVSTTSPRLQMEVDILNMPHLRHLHTNTPAILCSSEPRKLQKSKNLQTLSTISADSCSEEIFDRIPNIRKLSISGPLEKLFKVSGESCLFGCLRKLESLENLKLLNDIKSPLYSSLPSEKHFPKQLTKLTLSHTLLEWKEMSTLGKLQKLEVLKLKNSAFQGRLWQTEKGDFLVLKHLYIGRLDLVSWEASVDHFPHLRRLEINNCDKLKAFPQGLADIPSLQMVVLCCTSYDVASTAIQAQEKGNKNTSFKLSIYPPDLVD